MPSSTDGCGRAGLPEVVPEATERLMTRVVINAGLFANKGNEAMCLTVQTQLAARLPGAEFVLWRPPTEDVSYAREAGFMPATLTPRSARWESLPKRQAVAELTWAARWLVRNRRPLGLVGLRRAGIRRALAQQSYLELKLGGFHALVDARGYAYGDVWGLHPFGKVKALVDYCRANGRPAVFMPQAWGGFENDDTARAVRDMLAGGACRFYSRDSESSRSLESALCLPPGAVESRPDVAFLFDRGTRAQGELVLETMGCTMQRPIVAITPNMRVYERSSGRDQDNAYLQALAGLARHCVEAHGVDIVLHANEARPSVGGLDDRLLCGLVAAAVDRPDRCFRTDAVLSAEESRSLLGCADLVVGSRYHSFVFALEQGIPCLGISWSHKYGELFRDLGLGEYVVEMQNLDTADLCERFDRAWAAREELSRSIRERVEEYRVVLSGLFDTIAADIRAAQTSTTMQ